MRYRGLIIILLALTLATVFAPSVAAQQVEPPPPPPDPGVCFFSCSEAATGPIVEAAATDFGSPAGNASQPAQATARPPAWLQQCTWTVWEEGDELPDLPPDAEAVVPRFNLVGELDAQRSAMEGAAWVMSCPSDAVANTGAPIFAVVGENDIPPAVVNALIQEAYQQTPVVSMFPAASPSGSEDIPMVTRLSTWLWVDSADWVPVSATASIPPLSVTTTAVPSKTVWSGGHEPEVLECGQGVPFVIGVAEESQSTDCEMTWIHSSDVEDFTLDLDVVWNVTYACTAVCGTGDLPTLTSSSTRPIRVAEVQVITQ